MSLTLEEYEAEYIRQFRERVIDDESTIDSLTQLQLTGGRATGVDRFVWRGSTRLHDSENSS